MVEHYTKSVVEFDPFLTNLGLILTSFFAPNTPIVVLEVNSSCIGVLGAKNEVKISPRLVQNGSTGSAKFVKVKL